MRNFMIDIERCQNYYKEEIEPSDIRMWRCSNENLYDVLSTTNVKSKEILTVLSSSDQLFHFLNRDPKNVDTFDINYLTFYYYYLRKWLICYLGYYYPPRKMNVSFIKNMLEIVTPKESDELSAYYFWKKFSNEFSSKELGYLFYYSGTYCDEILDLDRIKQKLLYEKINFYNIDLTKKVNIKKKYDIIYTSNIIDYVSPEKLKIYRDNLEFLSKDDGIFITTLINSGKLSNEIMALFNEIFMLDSVRSTNEAISYIFKKK